MDYSFENLKWNDNKLSLYSYYPYYSSQRNEITLKILAFKKQVPLIIQFFQQHSVQALEYCELDFMEAASHWYAMSIPGHEANIANSSCEAICQHLANTFSWIDYIPQALQRIKSVQKSSTARVENRMRTSQEEHEHSIRYGGPTIQCAYGIILVDDILTTSNTFNACCGILQRETQCKHIFGLFMGKTASV